MTIDGLTILLAAFVAGFGWQAGKAAFDFLVRLLQSFIDDSFFRGFKP